MRFLGRFRRARSDVVSLGGSPYQPGAQISQSMGGLPSQEMGSDWGGLLLGAFYGNAVAFACMEARRSLFAEATFAFRSRGQGRGSAGRRAGPLFGTEALAPLELPWPGATTYDLLSRAIQDVDVAGNFYARRVGSELRRLRPDFITLAIEGGYHSGARVVGYVYRPRGDSGRAEVFGPEEILHWAPIPDPGLRFRGVSWLRPIIEELNADNAMTSFKTAYFEQGATANLMVEAGAFSNPEEFQRWVATFRAGHEGVENAHKTLYLANGAKATVIGSDPKSIDLKAIQGVGELRIAAAAGVPALMVGVSSDVNATYSNYGQARRKFADHTMRPLWHSWCAAAGRVLDVPAGAELWYDASQIDFLQEDLADSANIREADARTVRTLVDGGFEPGSVIAAVNADDMSLLVHSGKLSVQLQAPTAPGAVGAPPLQNKVAP